MAEIGSQPAKQNADLTKKQLYIKTDEGKNLIFHLKKFVYINNYCHIFFISILSW